MKLMIWLLSTMVVLYGVLCIVVYFQQEKLLFHPTRLPGDFAYTFRHPFTEVNLPVEGAVINLVHFHTPGAKGVILYLHGNGDIVARLEWIANYFVSLGYDVVLPDYRGYGKSSGRITNERTFYADMQAVYGYVQTHYPQQQITLYGQSIGSGLAARLAAENQPLRLILEAPYASMRDLAALRFPWIPTFLLKYPLRTDLWIEQVRCPVYFIHGTADRVIPDEASERLYRLVVGEKELLSVPGAGHGLLLSNGSVQQFIENILD
jgi:uncharacterized protein